MSPPTRRERSGSCFRLPDRPKAPRPGPVWRPTDTGRARWCLRISPDILIVGQSNPSGVTYTPAGGYPAGELPYATLEGPDLLTWNGVSWAAADTQQSGENTGSIGLFAGALGRRFLDAGASRVRII